MNYDAKVQARPMRQGSGVPVTAGGISELGQISDFLSLIRPAVKAGTPRKQIASGRGLKTTHADVLCKQRRRACTMNHRKAGKPAPQSGHRLQATRLHVVSLKIEDVAPHGIIVDRPTVRQRKTGHPVRYELSEHTRDAVDDYIRSAPRRVGEFLFPSRCRTDRCLTTRQYSRLVSTWIAGIDLNPALYGTHSLRRPKATLIFGGPGISAPDREYRPIPWDRGR